MSKTRKIARALLYPLSWIYGAVVYMRNLMFEAGILKQREFDIPVIGVGNITAGGTGKTPHAEYIVEQLSQHYNIAVLSRGYRRRTHGFLLAVKNSTPRDIGDEPYQIYHKFGCAIPVAVCESRVKGIEKIMEKCPDVNLIVLDDSFQHRYVKPKVSIVVSEYGRPVFEDHLLPYGRLREQKSALRRADVVIVSKCPDDVKPCDYMLYESKLDLFPYQKAYFTKFEYGQLVPVFPKEAPKVAPALHWLTSGDMLLAVAGIGNPKPFVQYIKSHKARVWVNIFPDHHEFDRDDMRLIEKRYDKMGGKNKFIITTEKDAVRIAHNKHFPDKLKPYIYYLPVRVDFMRDDDRTMIDDLNKLVRKK